MSISVRYVTRGSAVRLAMVWAACCLAMVWAALLPYAKGVWGFGSH